jgi:hypothetical protein
MSDHVMMPFQLNTTMLCNTVLRPAGCVAEKSARLKFKAGHHFARHAEVLCLR